jgi:hypothetical protein
MEMEKLLAALIPLLCVIAFGPLFCESVGTVTDGKSAVQAPDGGSGSNQSKVPLCEAVR